MNKNYTTVEYFPSTLVPAAKCIIFDPPGRPGWRRLGRLLGYADAYTTPRLLHLRRPDRRAGGHRRHRPQPLPERGRSHPGHPRALFRLVLSDQHLRVRDLPAGAGDEPLRENPARAPGLQTGLRRVFLAEHAAVRRFRCRPGVLRHGGADPAPDGATPRPGRTRLHRRRHPGHAVQLFPLGCEPVGGVFPGRPDHRLLPVPQGPPRAGVHYGGARHQEPAQSGN